MRLVVLFVLVAGCGSKPDECTRIKDRVRPVLVAMAREAGKRAIPEDIVAEFCADSKNEGERKMRACLLDASSDADAAACLEPEFAAYQHASQKHVAPPTVLVDAAIAAAIPVDAALPDALPIDAAPPIDPATLAAIPVADHTRGAETEVFAVDAPADFVMMGLWAYEPFLAVANDQKFTGHLVAPSKKSAALAIGAMAGLVSHVGALHGHATTVDFSFGGAPQRDVFRLLGEVLHANVVVAPGVLPDIVIIFHRTPADAIVDALAAFDGMRAIHAGNTIYVIPKDAKLPLLAKLSHPAADVSLIAHETTIQIASAALAAVVPFPASCETTAVSLRLRKVTAAEAARALEVAGGAPLVAGTCPIAEVTTLNALRARPAAIASAGNKHAAIATIDGTPSLLRPSDTVRIDETTLSIGHEQVDDRRDDVAMPERELSRWRTSYARTVAVARIGHAWRAWFQSATDPKRIIPFDPTFPYDMPAGLSPSQVEIGPTGVTVIDADGKRELIPLRAQ